MNNVIKMSIRLLIITLVFFMLIDTVIALSVNERGILDSAIEGRTEKLFYLEIDKLPEKYGIKIISDLDSLSIKPMDDDVDYSFTNGILLIPPPFSYEKVTVEISGTTQESYSKNNYKKLINVELYDNEHLYYQVIAIDENGKEFKEIGDEKQHYTIKKPVFYTDIEKKVNSIENTQLKNITKNLFDSGFIYVAEELTDDVLIIEEEVIPLWIYGVIIGLFIIIPVALYVGYFRGKKDDDEDEI